MTLKWGSTTVTAVKWGSTNVTQVNWGSTKVWPDGIISNFTTIFTIVGANGDSGVTASNSAQNGTHYRDSTKGTSFVAASISGNTFVVHSDYYRRSENYYNKVSAYAYKQTSSAIAISNKKIKMTYTVSGYSSSNGLIGTRGYYASSALTISSNKLSGSKTSLAGISISGMSNITGNGSFSVTSTTVLNGSYYLILGFGASANNNGTYQLGTAQATIVLNNVELVS